MRLFITLILFILFLFTARAGDSMNIVINEILFNPVRDGFDYVELFNNGPASADLSQVMIGNRNSTSDISSLKKVSAESLLLLPGAYAVITANSKWLKQQYLVDPDAIICEPGSMPSFPDQEGWVVLVDRNDTSVIDEVHYHDNWHFALIGDPGGVALEKIHPALPSGFADSWASASSASGYGSPGSQNSQYHQSIKGGLYLAPRVISPDNDGRDDFLTIGLEVSGTGYVANCSVFDVDGRKIGQPVKNAVLGSTNQFRWDGVDDYHRKVPAGIYIIVTEIFNLRGSTKKEKNTVVVK